MSHDLTRSGWHEHISSCLQSALHARVPCATQPSVEQCTYTPRLPLTGPIASGEREAAWLRYRWGRQLLSNQHERGRWQRRMRGANPLSCIDYCILWQALCMPAAVSMTLHAGMCELLQTLVNIFKSCSSTPTPVGKCHQQSQLTSAMQPVDMLLCLVALRAVWWQPRFPHQRVLWPPATAFTPRPQNLETSRSSSSIVSARRQQQRQWRWQWRWW